MNQPTLIYIPKKNIDLVQKSCEESLTNPTTKILDSINELPRKELLNLLTYVLEYYGGGRFTTFFMLKCWKSLRTITSVETIEVIQNMNYNRHQGMYSLSHFFLHFTGVGVYEMNVINSGLVNEPKFEVNHFVAPNRLLNSEWSRHICNGYGLTEEEIFELNCWNLEYQ